MARCTAATRSARCSSSAAGPRSRDEREQWTLRDVAPVVREHFGPMRRLLPATLRRCCCLLLPCARRRPSSAEQSRRAEASDADRRPRPQGGRRSAARHGALTHSANMVDGNWEVAYFARRRRGRAGHRRPAARGGCASRGPATRSPGRWPAATPAPSATSSTPPTSSCPSARSSSSACSTGGARWRAANLDLLVLLGFGVSHFFFNRAEIGVSVPLAVPGAPLPLRRARSGSACAVAARASGRSGRRPGCSSRPSSWSGSGSGSTSPTRGRSTSATPAWSAPTASPTANRSTTTSPTTSPRATPTARSTTSPTSPSRRSGPGRGSWDDLPAAHGAAVFFDLATFALLVLLGLPHPPRPRRQQARRDPRLRLGRLPYTALRARVELQRHPGGDAAGRHPPGPRPPGRARRDGRPSDPDQVRPGGVGADACYVSARGSCRCRGPTTPAVAEASSGAVPLQRHPRESRLPLLSY